MTEQRGKVTTSTELCVFQTLLAYTARVRVRMKEDVYELACLYVIGVKRGYSAHER
jgi:hypothetical protein